VYFGAALLSQFMSFLGPHFGIALTDLFDLLAMQRAAPLVNYITNLVMLEVIETKLWLLT
jgi:hypothetical protein